MHAYGKISAFAVTLLAGFGGVDCKFTHGTLSSKENWHFLDRFCFISQKGQLNYSLYFPQKYQPLQLYLYYDTDSQWKSAYKRGKSCDQKLEVLSKANHQIVDLNDEPGPDSISKCKEITDANGQIWMSCSGSRRFVSARERWWYLAIGNCNASNGIYIEYNLSMYNAYDQSDYLHYHFSADEFYILPTDVIFLLVNTLIFLVSCLVAVTLHARQMLHATYKLYMCSVLLECFSLLARVYAGSKYASDGFGSPFLILIGRLFRVATTLVFLWLLILLAKGWTVTRGRVSNETSWRIAIFMLSFSVTYAALFIYQMRAFDPAEVLYLYESPVGYAIIVLRMLAWFWFCYATHRTLLHYPEKRRFYYAFSITYTLWFWCGPVVIIICNMLLDNWFREKMANAIGNIVVVFGFVTFQVIWIWIYYYLYLTRPSAANSTFPFHVRTTQIEAINAEADIKADTEATSLPHHVYQVKYSADMDDVFTVSSQRELVNSGGSGMSRRMTELNQDHAATQKLTTNAEDYDKEPHA